MIAALLYLAVSALIWVIGYAVGAQMEERRVVAWLRYHGLCVIVKPLCGGRDIVNTWPW